MSSISNEAPPESGQGASARRVASVYGSTLPGAVCPGCRSPIDPDGDFCERCRAWLKQGQCRFCYQDLPTDAAFCVECGSPQAGFSCASCGRQDFFDFCPGCGDPLSEAAAAALQSLADDPVFGPSATDQDVGDEPTLQGRQSPSERTPAASETTEVAFAQALQTSPTAPIVRRRLFSKGRLDAIDEGRQASPASTMNAAAPPESSRQRVESHTGEIDDSRRQAILADLAAREQAARGVAAAVRQPIAQVVERALEQILDEASQRTFANPQDARRFHMALAQQLARRRHHPNAWQCHRYGCVHPGPHDCSAPQFGGVWLSS